MSSPETPAFEHRSVARVATDRPARYGRQLTSHMGRKITTTWDEASSTGSLSFNREGPVVGVVSLPARGPVLDKDLREAVVVGAAVGALVGSGTTAGVGAEPLLGSGVG